MGRCSYQVSKDKLERFIIEYQKDFNAKQAAIRAGYAQSSAERQGHRMLNDERCREVLSEVLRQKRQKMEATVERVILELCRIAFADIRKAVSWNQSGVDVKPSNEIDDDVAAAISEVAETCNSQGNYVKVKFHSKDKALDLLARHLGMLVEKEDGGKFEPLIIKLNDGRSLEYTRKE